MVGMSNNIRWWQIMSYKRDCLLYAIERSVPSLFPEFLSVLEETVSCALDSLVVTLPLWTTVAMHTVQPGSS